MELLIKSEYSNYMLIEKVPVSFLFWELVILFAKSRYCFGGV